jgi:hypothetical protein
MTPKQDSIFSTHKPQDTKLANRRQASDAYRRDEDRDSIKGLCEPREAIRHDASKPTPSAATPSVATLTQDSIAYMSLGKPQGTTQANQRRASDAYRREAGLIFHKRRI